ncbi:hypothetical protein H1S01_08885 [Heliobacterium chlorum]|uniref:Dinitrogenase iron-molybdenum cofactor biosynthesis domain-containing protein n=1 Tax=Heliobacterium chlorum TaxID=2698 RepID=A0ABR7T1G6_HELCL|nr:NifB/NifX family molybdenum-iron cluster-binding protein [Heliobacterium chlorum]MBC9784624.1 hypothetical protein [Heliobacterium chlorum]
MSILAIPVEGDQVCDHFGHSKSFAFIRLEDGKIVNQEILPTPTMQNRHEEFPLWFSSKQVDAVIVVRIGGGVYKTLKQKGMEIFKTSPASFEEAVQQFVQNTLDKVQEDELVSCGHKHH